LAARPGRTRTGRRRPETAARGAPLLLAALAGALLGAAGAPAAASDIRVELEDGAADLVTTAFERGAASAELVDGILRSRGYRLVFDHEAIRARRGPAEVEEAFRRALAAALDGEAEPGFGLERVRGRSSSYRRTLREIRSVGGNVRWRVVERVNGFLPPGSGFQSTAFLVLGGTESGRAFGDHDDVTLRLDDFVPPADSAPLDADRFASVLAHELFHVGFRAAGGLPPRPERPDAVYDELVEKYGRETVGEVWRASGEAAWNGARMKARFDAWVPPPGWEPAGLNEFLAMLSLVQNEGSATYVDAPLRDPGTTGQHAGEIAGWMRGVDADFRLLAILASRLAHSAGPDEIARLASDGLADNGPLYRVGYRIAERIDTFAGRRPLLSTMSGGPLEFFETYFETHPYGPGQMDSRTEQEIRAVIREIRGMGAFDPEE
jgi:hypothetical protein